MCYFNGVKVTRDELIRLRDLEKSIAHLGHLITPVQDAFDFHQSIILKANASRTDIDVVPMEWGFLPSYLKTDEEVNKFRRGYKDEKGWHKSIDTQNARGEELLNQGKMFRNAALNNRCLVLSSGFVEWRHLAVIGKKGKELKQKEKIPYHIFIKDVPYFFIAGIYNPWLDRLKQITIDTYSLITTDANQFCRVIHNKDDKFRMPVILPEQEAWEWIFDDLSENRISQLATYKHDYKPMRAYTISKQFKDSIDPLKAVTYEHVPAIYIDGKRYDIPPSIPDNPSTGEQRLTLF